MLKIIKNKLERKIEQLEVELNEKTIEYDNATKILSKNSLAMYQIQEIAFEPVMFSSDKIKISKVDFERLKESALKAYTSTIYMPLYQSSWEFKTRKTIL